MDNAAILAAFMSQTEGCSFAPAAPGQIVRAVYATAILPREKNITDRELADLGFSVGEQVKKMGPSVVFMVPPPFNSEMLGDAPPLALHVGMATDGKHKVWRLECHVGKAEASSNA